MPGVVERRPVVPFRLVRVHPVRALRGHAPGAVVAEVVRSRPAQRVRRQILEPFRIALANARLQRVVIAMAARGRRRDVRDEGCRRIERTPRLCRRPGRHIADARQRLVAFDRRQMRGMVADVPHVRRHRLREQVLREDVPLLRELRPQVGIPRAHLA